MNVHQVSNGQDEGVVRGGAAPGAHRASGDWHWSDEESDDDEPDMIDPAIAASSDEENDEDGDDSGYGTEESEAQSAVNQGHQEEDDDEEMWRELDEAIRMMDDEAAGEASSGRSNPEEYAPLEQNEIHEPPARLWEPARPPTPFRMVDSMSEVSETAEMAVADEGAADGVASPPPLEPEWTDCEAELCWRTSNG
ncbi:sarcoplasmic reticulum histidine-rich calcium-binding protein-like [Drosophila willistoni]|uniref:sarcoplasmic reticulum histidine-rich calcium-binding protein n=1 Tax=Drosophila willistoni TaxID=7260 RepID=UPI001F07656F|nr:sarcoplasmic reticulum histidine-rich calcium-binding protein [Drosophila willistoni]XP_046868745.1 sarcoplasmic reticulum histidine-rich calcium-binding protein-like [Drosophila willistoni]